MRTLITGISGFVGKSLAPFLVSQGWDVSGYDIQPSDTFRNVFIGDIHDPLNLVTFLEKIKPDTIFHLAGVIKTQNPEDFFTGNVLGTMSLFESLLKSGIKPRVLIASSSAVYGSGSGNNPITENFKLRPITDYAVSKVAQEVVANRFNLANNFPVITVRTFNLIGPGQSPDLACSSFARQIAIAENNPLQDSIKTGNLSAQRDFLDIRDAVRAYHLILQNGKPGMTYNVSSGTSVSLQSCLEKLIGMASKPLRIELDPKRIQKNDVSHQVGSNKRLEKTTDWHPAIPLEKSLLDLLNYWRDQVKI